MYINITDSITANNKGSSADLVNYLEKENRIAKLIVPESWFNHSSMNIEPYEVRSSLDNNVAKLSKTDAKFFLINISPSQKELKHLKDTFGDEGMKKQLKMFAEKVMDNYARNFKREAIHSAKDLLWFGKLENNRYYTYRDKEVLNGQKKRGEIKGGNQIHMQIIVSRKDANNRIKLSPMNTSKGKNLEHSKKLGQFNRLAFKQSGEILFDELFKFDRKLSETLVFANIQKNGNIAQKEQIGFLESIEHHRDSTNPLVNEMVSKVSMGLFKDINEMLQVANKSVTEFTYSMVEPIYTSSSLQSPMEQSKKKKRRKRKSHRHEIGR